MRRGRSRLLAAGAALGAIAVVALPLAADAKADAIDAVFAQWNSRETPGCVIAVERDGRPVASRAYGMADLELAAPNALDTVFEAGSVSKQFTAAAVLSLVEAGKIRLDDDVRSVIPELPDYGRTITIDHLLNHTSGLRDWGGISGLAGWPRTTREMTQGDVVLLIARQKALNFEPGAESSYTNSGYNLLAEIVRRVSGKSLADYTRDTFFAPLGMTSSQWRDDFRRIVPRRAQAYRRTATGYEQEMPFEDAYGNGGLLTTVGDLQIWNRALESGALGPFITGKLSEPSRLRDGRPLTYARGLFVSRVHGEREISHGGSTAGYRAWLGRYPDRKLSVAMLCNASNAGADQARALAARFLPKHAEPPPPDMPEGLFIDQASGAPLEPADLRAALSRKIAPDRIEIVRRDGDATTYLRAQPADPAKLRLSDYVGEFASDEVGAVYAIVAEGQRLVWRIRGRAEHAVALKPLNRDAFQGADATFRFDRDAAGKVIALRVSIERARNVPFARIR